MLSISWNYNPRPTHVYYNRLEMRRTKHQNMLLVLKRLNKYVLASKNLGMTHLYDLRLHSFSGEDIRLMILDTGVLINKCQTSSIFQVT